MLATRIFLVCVVVYAMWNVKLTNIGLLQSFDCTDTTSLGPCWTRWVRAFDLYADGKGVKNVEQQKALLLHTAGLAVQDIFFTLELEGAGENAYDRTVVTLNLYFKPRVNVPYERHVFHSMCQSTTETVVQYITRLRQQAESCNFGNIGDVDERIRDQVIEKCTSHHLRRKLLEKGCGLTLEQLKDIACALEESEKQAKSIEGVVSDVNKLTVKD